MWWLNLVTWMLNRCHVIESTLISEVWTSSELLSKFKDMKLQINSSMT
uniref:Uncharacterized protein n=1 Tax=Arundo donax TaxID=35708 RepID=A0A0A9ABD1_ARUDO